MHSVNGASVNNTTIEQYLSNILTYRLDQNQSKGTVQSVRHLRATVPFVTVHLEIFHCTHHPVIPKSDLYFTSCSTLNALSKRTSK